MKFLGKMYFKIMLKVTKNQGLTLSLENTFFEKPQRGSGLISIFLRMAICISKTIEHNSEQIIKYQITLVISTGKNNERKRETTFILLTKLEQLVKKNYKHIQNNNKLSLNSLQKKQELLHHLKTENGFAM